VSLLPAPAAPEGRAFRQRLSDILSGQAPPAVEPIPMGRPRP
jgi:hypothetical protein